MQSRNTACPFGNLAHIDSREIHRVLNVSIIDEVNYFLYCHYGAIVFGFFSACSQVRNNDGISHLHDRRRSEVGYVSTNLARFKRSSHSFSIDKRIARKVQHNRAFAHLGTGIKTNHAFGIVCGRHVYGDEIASTIDFVHVGDMMYITIDIPCCVHRYKRVVAIDFHTKVNSSISNQCTNGA